MERPRATRRSVWAWALYDWGNSAFATAVMAGLFPVMLKTHWAGGLEPTRTTFLLGLASAVVAAAVALLAPVGGAMADAARSRGRWLAGFAVAGATATALLAVPAAGQWGAALLLYGVAAFGFGMANVFYDALLTVVARPGQYERVSALGYALGYLGGGLFFAAAVAALAMAGGDEGRISVVRAVFAAVAVWWVVFTLPVIFWVREGPHAGILPRDGCASVREAWRRLGATLKDVRRLRAPALFLLAYWLYIDGVHTIIRMAADYGVALGLEPLHLMAALLVTQLVGFPAALAFGRLAERWGSRRGIWFGLAVYGAVTVFAAGMTSVTEFYLLAVTIGLVQGGVQAASRAWYARLVPREAAAEFFGFFNVVGRFAAVLGPLAVGVAVELTGEHRVGLLPLLLFFGLGALLLRWVPMASPRR